MARNSAGTHSLPSTTNPVVTNTNITPTWANGTLQDVSAEITDSLSRSGKGGMTAPLRTADGTVAAPAQAFTSETGSGWFRHAAGELRLAILGVYRIAATATLTTINSAASVLGTLTASGKITAQAGADVTGTLAVIDDGGTTKKVSVDAPTGLASDYALTLPTALPGSTLPVTLSAVGALSTGQITGAQIGDLGLQTSSSSSTFSTSSATRTDVTGLTVTITSAGKPVFLMLQPERESTDSMFFQVPSGSAVEVAFLRGATVIARWTITNPSITTDSYPYPLQFIDPVAAGTYTYKVQVQTTSGTVHVRNMVLTAW